MTSSRVEDQYLPELVECCVNMLQLKKRPAVLVLGGGQWRFGRLLAAKLNAKTLMYADNDKVALEQAELNGVVTTICDPADFKQLSSVGKSDVIILKQVFERVAPEIAEGLEDYLWSIFKALKLHGRALIISRIRPSLPLPTKTLEKWAESVPNHDVLVTQALECNFTSDVRQKSFDVVLHRENWAKDLLTDKFPYMEGNSKMDIAELLKDEGDTIRCKDDIVVIVLTKIIS